jgi:hypothetical protein
MGNASDVAMNERPNEAALRNYEYFCLASLLVMLLVLIQRGSGLEALMPLLIGLGGIAGRWRVAPFLLLAALAVFLTGGFGWWRVLVEEDILADLILAAAVLGYVAGQCRLTGLAGRLLPADPRLPKRPAGSIERADLGLEIVLLVISLPAWAMVAQAAWEQLPSARNDHLAISPSGWRLIVLTWLLGLGGIVAAGMVAYLNRRYRTPAEAALFLQDVLWRETRGEQRRLYRWIAWRRLRSSRRKERS